MKYGLALEGGGARGAYHIGAVKALIENGYEFDKIVGTSIGAVNAAFIVQDKLDVIYNMWHTMSYSDLFDIDNHKLKRALKIDFDTDVIKYMSKKLGQIIKEKGIDTLKMRELLQDNITEEKIRNSDIKYGLVTICLSDIKAHELYIDEIPQGKLIDYILASSNLPFFKRSKIDNKKYLDGGIYDNCPVNMLERAKCKKVIAIRTYKINRIRGFRKLVKRNNVTINMISPVDMLPSILNFDTEALNEMLSLGYYDALKMIKKLDGYRYYVNPNDEKHYLEQLNNVQIGQIEKIAKLLNIKLAAGDNIKDVLNNKIIPYLAVKTKFKEATTKKEMIFALVEFAAQATDVDRFKIYDFDELLDIIKSRIEYKGNPKAVEAIFRIVKNM